MKYVGRQQKVVKILVNMTFERLIQLLSNLLHGNSQQNNILLNMKARSLNSYILINIVNDQNVDYLSGLSLYLRECIPILMKTIHKLINTYMETTNFDVH